MTKYYTESERRNLIRIWGLGALVLLIVSMCASIYVNEQRARLREGVVMGNYTVTSNFVMCSKREGCRLLATMENEDTVVAYDITPTCVVCDKDMEELYSVYAVGSQHELYSSKNYPNEYYEREEFDKVMQERYTLYRSVMQVLGGVVVTCALVLVWSIVGDIRERNDAQ